MVIEKTLLYQIFKKIIPDMKMFYTITIVGIATILLLSSSSIIKHIDLQLHPDSFINGLAKYQIYALVVGVLTMLVFLLINPESKQLLNIGNLSAIADKEKWLGVNGKTTWLSNGLELFLFISTATGIFMFLGVKQSESLSNFQWWFIPFVLLFSLTNSFAEELIYRFGIIAGLNEHYTKMTILLVSAILFGLPHFSGNPGGITGVIMSGLLGYILCKASLETKGLGIAWAIHFFQDIIIFTALMMINIKK